MNACLKSVCVPMESGPEAIHATDEEAACAQFLSPTGKPGDALEKRRERQRGVCAELLARWVPLAVTEDLILRKEGRSGPVIDEEPFEAALKAGAFVLKVLERMARLDGLDTPEKREAPTTELADPVELARRVQVVSPMLAARLSGEIPGG